MHYKNAFRQYKSALTPILEMHHVTVMDYDLLKFSGGPNVVPLALP